MWNSGQLVNSAIGSPITCGPPDEDELRDLGLLSLARMSGYGPGRGLAAHRSSTYGRISKRRSTRSCAGSRKDGKATGARPTALRRPPNDLRAHAGRTEAALEARVSQSPARCASGCAPRLSSCDRATAARPRQAREHRRRRAARRPAREMSTHGRRDWGQPDATYAWATALFGLR